MNIGLIGCGFIGSKHAESLARSSDCRLVAVSDLDNERMEQLRKTYLASAGGRTDADIACYPSYRDLLADKRVDAVAVTTTSGLHAKLAREALESGKHVVVEKPMAMTIGEARTLIRLAETSGRKLAVCHQKRFFPHLQTIQRIVREGRLGRLILGGVSLCYNRDDSYYQAAKWRGTWEADGGVLLNQAIHDIDLLLWMAAEPRTAYGRIARLLRQTETEDTAIALLELADGALVRMEATVCAARASAHERISLIGSDGAIVLSGKFLGTVETWQVEGVDPPPYAEVDPYRHLYDDLAMAVRDNRRPLIDGREGIRALEAILAVYRSVRDSAPVPLPLDEFSTVEMKHIAW